MDLTEALVELKSDITRDLMAQRGTSYNEAERDEKFSQIAHYTKAALEKTQANPRKRPQPYPQQQQQQLRVDMSAYLTPAQTSSKLPTLSSASKVPAFSTSELHAPQSTAMQSRPPSVRASTTSGRSNASKHLDEARQTSLAITDSMFSSISEDFFLNHSDLISHTQQQNVASAHSMPSSSLSTMPTIGWDYNYNNSSTQANKRTKTSHVAHHQSGHARASRQPSTWSPQETLFARRPIVPPQDRSSNLNFSSATIDVSSFHTPSFMTQASQMAAQVNPSLLKSPPTINTPSIKSEKCPRSLQTTHSLSKTNARKVARPIKPAPVSAPSSSAGSNSSIATSCRKQPKIETVVYTTSNPGAQRKRIYRRVFCDKCHKKKEGFRGQHELTRHKQRQHCQKKKVWIIQDISSDAWLSQCKNCSRRKTYGQDYNAAAHLRRAHFNKILRTDSPQEVKRKQDGKDLPAMEDLRAWMTSVYVDKERLTDGKYLDDRVDAIVPENGNDDGDDEEENDDSDDDSYNAPAQFIGQPDNNDMVLAQSFTDHSFNTNVDYLSSTPNNHSFDPEMTSNFQYVSNVNDNTTWSQSGPMTDDHIPRLPLGQHSHQFIDHLEQLELDPTRVEGLYPNDLQLPTQFPTVFPNFSMATPSINPSESMMSEAILNSADFDLSFDDFGFDI